jgi:hypothetical protein
MTMAMITIFLTGLICISILCVLSVFYAGIFNFPSFEIIEFNPGVTQRFLFEISTTVQNNFLNKREISSKEVNLIFCSRPINNNQEMMERWKNKSEKQLPEPSSKNENAFL